ncbi:hypothetical protein LQL77_31460 [Rhodococcus cerastii]|nr:hypothetical protein [Rhodococcus cerastii]
MSFRAEGVVAEAVDFRVGEVRLAQVRHPGIRTTQIRAGQGRAGQLSCHAAIFKPAVIANQADGLWGMWLRAEVHVAEDQLPVDAGIYYIDDTTWLVPIRAYRINPGDGHNFSLNSNDPCPNDDYEPPADARSSGTAVHRRRFHRDDPPGEPWIMFLSVGVRPWRVSTRSADQTVGRTETGTRVFITSGGVESGPEWFSG